MEKQELELRFISFVSMLGTSAMQHLGKIADPMSGKVNRSLEMAKATIDTLIMFQEKTVNNLSKTEKDTLASLVTNLQLNYVEESSKPEPKEEEEKKEKEGGEQEIKAESSKEENK